MTDFIRIRRWKIEWNIILLAVSLSLCWVAVSHWKYPQQLNWISLQWDLMLFCVTVIVKAVGLLCYFSDVCLKWHAFRKLKETFNSERDHNGGRWQCFLSVFISQASPSRSLRQPAPESDRAFCIWTGSLMLGVLEMRYT